MYDIKYGERDNYVILKLLGWHLNQQSLLKMKLFLFIFMRWLQITWNEVEKCECLYSLYWRQVLPLQVLWLFLNVSLTDSWWKNVCSYKHLFLQIMAKIFFRRWHLLSPKPYWYHIEFACIWCSHNFTHPGQYLSLFQQCLFWGQLMFLFACLISFNPLILSVVLSSWCSWASSLNAEYAEEFYTGKLT